MCVPTFFNIRKQILLMKLYNSFLCMYCQLSSLYTDMVFLTSGITGTLEQNDPFPVCIVQLKSSKDLHITPSRLNITVSKNAKVSPSNEKLIF